MARFIDSASSNYTTMVAVPQCNQVCCSSAPVNGKRCVVDITNVGTCSWVAPYSGAVTFEVWGAGGSGGAKCCCDCGHNGPGGGPGGFASWSTYVTAGDTYTVVVGQGGHQSLIGSCSGMHNCCMGQAGGTSYVTGPAFTAAGVTLCATGGGPGKNDCLTGGAWASGVGAGGIGYATGAAANTAVTSRATNSGFTTYNSSCYCFHNKAITGNSPGTNNSNNQVGDWYWHTQIDGSGSAPGTWGMYPGGGGTTPLTFQSCNCSPAGVGANGLVRIKW